MEWVHYRVADYSLFDLDARDGWLRIKSDGHDFIDRLCKSRIFMFAADFSYEASALVKAELKDGAQSGITLFYDDRNYVIFAMNCDGRLSIEERICGRYDYLYDVHTPKYDEIILKIKVDKQTVKFAYEIDGKETELDFTYNAFNISDEAVMKDGGGYSGAKIGIFVAGKDSFADFDYFRYLEK